MKSETLSLLNLTETSYDEYNDILPLIKQKLGARSSVFEATLAEELPLTTARRAYRTAICVAMDEEKVYREVERQRPVTFKKKAKTVRLANAA